MSRVESAISDGRIHQGDLFTNVEVPLIDGLRDPGRIPEVRLEVAAHLLVVTQDCDLLWDREARVAGTTSEEKVLRGALVIPGWPADQVRVGLHREGATKIDRDLWKPIVQNMHPRWYFLKRDGPLAPADMLFDIRAYSTVPPVYMERQWMAQRIARLGDLWGAHLLQRVTAYLGRIALPDDPPIADGT